MQKAEGLRYRDSMTAVQRPQVSTRSRHELPLAFEPFRIEDVFGDRIANLSPRSDDNRGASQKIKRGSVGAALDFAHLGDFCHQVEHDLSSRSNPTRRANRLDAWQLHPVAIQTGVAVSGQTKLLEVGGLGDLSIPIIQIS